MDPLAEEFYSWSPYAYCYNNPLRYTDPDGMAPGDENEPIELDEVVVIAPAPKPKQASISPAIPWYIGVGQFISSAALRMGGVFTMVLTFSGDTSESEREYHARKKRK